MKVKGRTKKVKSTQEQELTISYSRIKTWKSNHYDHYQKYVRGLRPKGKAGALIRGSMVHECIEAYNNGKPWKRTWNKLAKEFYDTHFKEELEVVGDIPKLTKKLLENYTYYYEDSDEDVVTLENELHFVLPLIEINGIMVNIEGYIDALVQKPDGKIYIRDYKTFSRMPQYNSLQFNFQSSIYMWAAEEMGYKVQGMEWDIIRPVMPKEPEILQSGKMSQKVDKKITPYEVLRVIEENDLDKEDYEDYIDSLSFEDFFRRFFIRKDQRTIDTIMQDVKETAEQIVLYGNEWKDMNLETKFPSQYMDLWRAEMSGSDVSYIINSRYDKKEDEDGKETKHKEKTKEKRKRHRVKNKKVNRFR